MRKPLRGGGNHIRSQNSLGQLGRSERPLQRRERIRGGRRDRNEISRPDWGNKIINPKRSKHYPERERNRTIHHRMSRMRGGGGCHKMLRFRKRGSLPLRGRCNIEGDQLMLRMSWHDAGGKHQKGKTRQGQSLKPRPSLKFIK